AVATPSPAPLHSWASRAVLSFPTRRSSDLVAAFGFQHIGQFAGSVLSLGNGQAVTRYEDHFLRAIEQHGQFVSRRELHFAFVESIVLRLAHASSGCHRTAEQYVGQGTVHRLTHDGGQDDTGRAHQRTGDDQAVVAQYETGSRTSQTRVRVQQCHHHRHVGATDRHHQTDTQHQTQYDQSRDQQVRVQRINGREVRSTGQQRQQTQFNDPFEQLNVGGIADFAFQLAHGNERTGQGNRTDQDGQNHCDGPVVRRYEVTGCAQFLAFQIVGCRDQQRSTATDTVQAGDHFRHIGHRHFFRHENTDSTTYQYTHNDPGVIDHVVVEQRYNHRHQHTDGRHLVTAHGGFRSGHALDAEDEQHGGNEVTQVDQNIHCRPLPYFFLNMFSMRSVTMKPATMLMVASTMAATPSTVDSRVV